MNGLFAPEQIAVIISWLKGIREKNGTLYILGNGGSQANASHLTLHLVQAGIKAVDMMAATALFSAFSNDYSFEKAVVNYLKYVAKQPDRLLVLSGSGDSVNIIMALMCAKKLKLSSLGLLGFDGGMALGLCDYAVVIDSVDYGTIEDAHSAMIHAISRLLYESGT